MGRESVKPMRSSCTPAETFSDSEMISEMSTRRLLVGWLDEDRSLAATDAGDMDIDASSLCRRVSLMLDASSSIVALSLIFCKISPSTPRRTVSSRPPRTSLCAASSSFVLFADNFRLLSVDSSTMHSALCLTHSEHGRPPSHCKTISRPPILIAS